MKRFKTNEIIAKVKDSSKTGTSLLLSVGKKYLARAVMHLNVSDNDVEESIASIRNTFGNST